MMRWCENSLYACSFWVGGIVTNSLIVDKEMRINQCEFRFDSLRRQFNDTIEFAFACEDSTSTIARVDYNAETDCFIGFSTPLKNGIPKIKFLREKILMI